MAKQKTRKKTSKTKTAKKARRRPMAKRQQPDAPKTGPGRPKGTPNADVVTRTLEPSRCPKCDSSERGPYYNFRRHEIAGVDSNGREYVAIEWRRCRCEGCGQVRDDKIYIYLKAETPSDPF